jgi:hypothetical protein
MSNSGDHHNAGFDPDGEASKISIEPEGVSSGANVTNTFGKKVGDKLGDFCCF